MRKSKSDPSKYARNYRKISQRHMTAFDDVDEEKEIKRLRNLLRNSDDHLSPSCDSKCRPDAKDDMTKQSTSKGKGKRKKNVVELNEINDGENDLNESINNELHSILSPDLQEELKSMGCGGDNEMIITQSRKKKKVERQRVVLTPEEIKEAKKQKKNAERKLAQLEKRAEQKKRRSELYAKLEETSLSKEQLALMQSSANLGKKVSKKEMLKRLVMKEKAGLPLNYDEKDLLYTKTTIKEINGIEEFKTGNNVEANLKNNNEVVPLAFPSSGKKKKKKEAKKENSKEQEKKNEECDHSFESNEINNEENEKAQSNHVLSKSNCSKEIETDDPKKENKKTASEPTEMSSLSFAERMMAGLRNLKAQSTAQKEELDKKEAKEIADKKEEAERLEEDERKKRKVYIPSNPAVLKTAAQLDLYRKSNDKSNWRILPISRPGKIEENRYNLPVSTMEFEIIDAVKSNDVAIICSETGSGKSTQIPQFLYESGITLGNATNEAEDEGLLIGVTQPRRVAAVSTAKRVCYEMGHSRDNGQSIRSQNGNGNGNLVAYQTRYESAGLGSKTRVKFMTDGILLSEIKSDLLLRKYSAVVLDEAHERNLNTDVLLGLLSASLPLRRKAAEEGSLPPLKLIIMSATLRVEDFTANSKLFPGNPPVVVKVPGRTFPVTIHHSKLTELDDYETIAFQKVCKIHRKLPQGGILVFMTGKQEIIRMVNRLRKTLAKKGSVEHSRFLGTKDIQISESNSEGDKSNSNSMVVRDMDDEEADGDLFERKDNFDEIDTEDDVDETSKTLEKQSGGGSETEPSTDVLILPLYSLLSAQEQGKVFAPLAEGTRLIVVATNIAETSITIPGISYVVDTGRQKCRNYHAGTGVASYDVMWISKAAADQRAGRAGRTGPGHCYRLYSSSMYERHFDQFALPEVLTRPLEDVVLAMKAMNIFNVAEFPFPTPPDSSQLNSAIKLLSNIGCVDVSQTERYGGDGSITKMGAAVATLPLGVRYGKMLLVAAQANVLDYAIALVAILSESSPFTHESDDQLVGDGSSNHDDDGNSLSDLDEIDRNAESKIIKKKKKAQRKRRWRHDGGDILAGVHAVGAYSYASRSCENTKGNSNTRKKFCEENGLNSVIMERIQKMRIHLARLAKQRLGNAEGFAAKTGGVMNSMSPPNKLQEELLKQAIASGLLDNVARRLPPGTLLGDKSVAPRAAYFSCRSSISQPLFIDQKSVLFQRDFRHLPEWVCYDSVVRKATKDGSSISTMRNVTPIDPSSLGRIAQGSQLLFLGDLESTPHPVYDSRNDRILCSVTTKFGDRGWLLPPNQVDMKMTLAKSKSSGTSLVDDHYRWFARYLLEGKILKELADLPKHLNDEPAIITRKKLVPKVTLLVSALRNNEIYTGKLLRKHWAEKDNKFLFKNMKAWAKRDETSELKKVWILAVKKSNETWSMQAKA